MSRVDQTLPRYISFGNDMKLMHTKEFNRSTVTLPVSHENICLDCLYISFAFKRDSIYFPEENNPQESKIKVTLLKNNYTFILRISISHLTISNFEFFQQYQKIFSTSMVKNNISIRQKHDNLRYFHKHDHIKDHIFHRKRKNDAKIRFQSLDLIVLSPPYLLELKSLPDKSPVHSDRINRIMGGSRCSTRESKREFIVLFIFPILSLVERIVVTICISIPPISHPFHS